LLEVVSGIFIFSMMSLIIYLSFKAGLQSLVQSKRRIAATQLANERMEIIRNMRYKDIGTQGGVPSGVLPQNETVTKSNQSFNIHTFIRYIDDPFDDVAPTDDVPTDYKEVKIEVSWQGIRSGYGVSLVSHFVPRGVETDVGGGTLRINVINQAGAGVSGAEVHIQNEETNPPIDISTSTNSDGTVLLTGMPAGDQNYIITASGADYEEVTTLPPFPTSEFDPVDVHASVVEGLLNTKAIIIDKLGGFSIYSRNMYDEPIGNVNFNFSGGRIIGHVHGTNDPIYGYNEALQTDASGLKVLEDMPAGPYNLTLDEPGYTLVGSNIPLPIAIAPDETLNFTMILADNDVDSLVATVKNSQTNEKISGANVRIYNTAGSDITLTTGVLGQVYFPPNDNPPVPLVAGNYYLEASAVGFTSYSDEIYISKLVQKLIELAPE